MFNNLSKRESELPLSSVLERLDVRLLQKSTSSSTFSCLLCAAHYLLMSEYKNSRPFSLSKSLNFLPSTRY